jgi:hypothetical protein
MSSSNFAVRMEHAATDQLSEPARPSLRLVASNERPVQKIRASTSFAKRKFIIRDQGLRLFNSR